MSDREPSSKGSWQEQLGSSGQHLGLGLQLAGSVLVYVAIGYFLDRWLETSPWFLIGGAVVGMGAFFVQLARVVRAMNRESGRRRGDRPVAGATDETEWKDWPEDDWDRDDWKREATRDGDGAAEEGEANR